MVRWKIIVGTVVILTSSLGSLSLSTVEARPMLIASGGAASPLPLGTIQTGTAPAGSCPNNDACIAFSVACPGVLKAARGLMDVEPAAGTRRGLTMFFSGGQGTGWWGDTSLAAQFLANIRQNGIEAVQVRWIDSWLVASPGETIGPARLACRTATVVKWAHDHLYLVPNNVPPPGPLVCGFCITGNSGGSSQVSYDLSFYGLDSILNADFPTSGPPHAALAKGCLRDPRYQKYWFDAWAAGIIDDSYGFLNNNGPCSTHNSSYTQRWLQDAVDTGGNDFYYPSTRVHFIFGGNDPSVAPYHGQDYYNRLKAAGPPHVSEEIVPGMPHPITQSQAGLQALRNAILAPSPTA